MLSGVESFPHATPILRSTTKSKYLEGCRGTRMDPSGMFAMAFGGLSSKNSGTPQKTSMKPQTWFV